MKNKYIDNEKINRNGVSNFCYNVSAGGFGCSIEHCELNAMIDALNEIWTYCYKISCKNDDNIPNLIALAIDSQVVVNWIGGDNKMEDVLVYNEIKSIYEAFKDFEDFGIIVHLAWVKAHNNKKLNEIADVMAKLVMMSSWKCKKWSNYDLCSSKNEWINYSFVAAKNNSKYKAWCRTDQLWHTYKVKNKNKLDSLSKNVIDWDIKINLAYKHEMRNLDERHWKMLNVLRSGHGILNAQIKYYFNINM